MLYKQQICLDCHGTTIKIILGNLIEERTVCKDTLMSIFSYQVILVFVRFYVTKRGDSWIHTIIKTKTPMTLNVKRGC